MRFVALRNGTNLRYTLLDHLGSTSVVTDSSGAQYGYTRYYPYGSTRDSGGFLDTSKKFTGQRLDGTGLYYYEARYYDPTIGRFISADPSSQILTVLCCYPTGR
jgi:RHS repeat-associated protein